MMHSTHFIYGYMASDICERTIHIVREETCCCHYMEVFSINKKRVFYMHHPTERISCEALAATRNISVGPP